MPILQNSNAQYFLPNGKQILDEISKLQLSDSTCMRRSQELAANILLNFTDQLQQSKCFSLALDSSTDKTSISQLLLFVNYTVVIYCKVNIKNVNV